MRHPGKCFYCEREFNWLTRDHVLPRSKGGKAKNNIVLACQRCNSYKANWTLPDFILYLVHFRPKYFLKHSILDTVIENCMRIISGEAGAFYWKPPVYKKVEVPNLKIVGKIDLKDLSKRPKPEKRVKTKRKKKVPSQIIYSEKLPLKQKAKIEVRNQSAFFKMHGLGMVSKDNFHEIDN